MLKEQYYYYGARFLSRKKTEIAWNDFPSDFFLIVFSQANWLRFIPKYTLH